MKVHILQHASFEGPGSIAAWLEARRASVSCSRLFENDALPDIESIDMLIIMGGPMSVNDEIEFPWLVREKQLIRKAVEKGVSILGICLGAQLIASAMGAKVYRNPAKEIGWFPVRAISSDIEKCKFPGEFIAFHWHGETFDLPPGAIHLGESDACRNQAFQLNRNVIGLQFHLETTIESASLLIENCRPELVPGAFIQSETSIRSAPISLYESINAVMEQVLWYLAK